MQLKKKLSSLKRRLWRAKRPSLNQIDAKLSEFLNFEDGFFIEAGANDGYQQSNTYYLEKSRNWQGILIEGIPELFEKCCGERPSSTVINSALVAPDFEAGEITMHYAGLMSVVDLSMKTDSAQNEHVQRGIDVQNLGESYSVTVPARTLESILDEHLNHRQIDFFSLDVEGYELNVLQGLNLDKYRPTFILVEARFFNDVNELLTSKNYELVKQITHHDYLYKST